MFRRLLGNGDTETETLPDTLTPTLILLKELRPEKRSELVLKELAASLPGEVKGYTVKGLQLEAYQFEAVHGYAPTLKEVTPMHGPWRNSGPRIVDNLVRELFTPNKDTLRAALRSAGLRDIKSTLVVPISSERRIHGALVLHQHNGPAFAEEQLKLATQWGEILGSVQLASYDLLRTRKSLVEFTRAFVEAMEAQDFTQLGHAGRVTAYALSLGRTLEYSREELADLYFAAMLHDIGKLGVSSDLSREDTMHPQRGANLVASSPLLAKAAEGIKAHHEHWDGTGFPLGLSREEIPTIARIIAIADSFDILSSERGEGLPVHEVVKTLERRAGHELDPNLVKTFNNILLQGKSTAELSVIDHDDLPF